MGNNRTLWTNEQIAAINYSHSITNRSACVTAAAGSGKTALLVERVVGLIKGGVPADKLAVLTFTRNAAEEFRSRMTAAIEEAARSEGADRIPRDQIIKFRSAAISTIDSFCLGILKENTEMFGLPVNFTIVEEGRAEVMLTRALDNAMEYFYSRSFKLGSAARNILYKTFSYKDDRELRENIKSVYRDISSLDDPGKWMNDCVAAYSSPSAAGLRFAGCIIDETGLLLDRAQTALNSYANYVNGVVCHQDVLTFFSDILTSDAAHLTNYRNSFARATANGNTMNALLQLADTLERPQFETARASFKKGTDQKEDYESHKDAFQAIRKKYKDAISDVRKYISIDKNTINDELSQQHTAISALLDVVCRLRDEYTEIKRAANCIDYSDCERLLLDVLKSNSQFCGELSERYSHIIVDEFQDTNDMQYEIFRLISDNEKNLFFVGDIKQSIYAFRGGNPRIMSRLCGSSNYDALPLTKNFRSRPEVIETVNKMFDGVMTVKYGDVDYSNKNQLTAGASYPANTSGTDYSSELYLLNYSGKNKTPDGDEITAYTAEARFAANKIRDMINSGFEVMNDEGSTRKCSSGDFCILLRNSTHAAEYKRELEALGIPVNMQGGESYLGTEEISLIISFLKVIDNPMLDEELIKVLMSPLYSFSAEEMAQARLGTLGFADTGGYDISPLHSSCRKKALYSCIKLCSEPSEVTGDSEDTDSDTTPEDNTSPLSALLNGLHKKSLDRGSGHPKCVRFIEDFNSFRRFAANNSIERLIKKIYDDTQFLSVISVFERGSQKLANIRLLLKYVADFENYGGGTLSDFLRYTDNLKGSSKSFEQALIPKDAADAVRIMTFHASKGLEMPIVILGGLGGKINRRDSTGALVFSRTAGIGLHRIFPEQRYHSDNLGYNATALAQRREQTGEELRVLYVAMTRAREKLIMLGKCDCSDLSGYFSNNFTPDYALSGGCLIDWILSSFMRYSAAVPQSGQAPQLSIPCLKMGIITNVLPEHPEEPILPPDTDSAAPDTDKASGICKAISTPYKDEKLTRMRSKFTVTEIAHMVTEEAAPDYSHSRFLTRPAFGKDKNKGASIGNAYHRVMEIIPLDELRGSTDMQKSVEDALSGLVNSGMLTEDEYKAVKPENIARFFESGLGRRMLSSSRCEREFPVFAEVAAGDIYVSEQGDTTETIVQGRVDMFFYEGDSIVMVDYKSDSKENLEREFSAYAKQLSIYRTILPVMTGVDKDKISIFIYSFSCCEAKEV